MHNVALGTLKNSIRTVNTTVTSPDPHSDNPIVDTQLVVGFAVPDAPQARILLSSRGDLTLDFDGADLSPEEIHQRAVHAVEIYRTITGDEDTQFSHSHLAPIET